MHFTVKINPNEGPYYGGQFSFSGESPDDYPFRPPVITCNQTVYHPNLLDEHICLSIIRVNWSPAQSLSTVAEGLLFLMQYPNSDDPLNIEAGKMLRSDKEKFEKIVKSTMKGKFYEVKSYSRVCDK